MKLAPFQASWPGLTSAFLGQNWRNWLQTVLDRVNQTFYTLQRVSLSTQDAAISATAIPVADGAITTGLYRVSWHARITRAGTVSSSLTLTIGYTDGAVAITQSGAAITGNTTNSVQSGTLLIRADAGTDITYSTAYSSVGATSMLYRVDLVLEEAP